MSAISFQEISRLNARQYRAMSLQHLRNGTIMNTMGPSGGGKTKISEQISAGITQADLAGAPAFAKWVDDNDQPLTGVIDVLINCASLDEYKWPGMAMPSDQTIDIESAREQFGVADFFEGSVTLSTTTQPVWFARTLKVARDNPDKVIRVVLDEINTASPAFQAQIMETLTEKRTDGWQFEPDVADRLCFCLMGNRPEDLPPTFFFAGPLARRTFHYHLEITTKEFLEHIEKNGNTNAYVHHALQQNPNLLFVQGVNDNGGISALDPTGESGADTTAVANGLCPRMWEQLSCGLNDMISRGLPLEDMLLMASGTMPRAALTVISTAITLADAFAPMEEILRAPETCAVAKSPLEQAMHVRLLSLQIEHLTVDQAADLVVYIHRMDKSVQAAVASIASRRAAIVSGNAKAVAALQVVREATQDGLIRSVLASVGVETKNAPAKPSVIDLNI